MSSLKQIEANRRNAFKSTGPTTDEGKERSRCNAVRHGLTAETVIARLEDAEDYQAFEAAVIADYDAQTAVERELVLRLASVLWRLRRAIGIESGIFESLAEGSSKKDDPFLGGAQVNPATDRLYVVTAITPRDVRAQQDVPLKTAIADRFLRLAELPTFPLDRLSRYEHLLWRQARQLVITLESFRRRQRQHTRSVFPFSFRRREPGDFSEEFR
jgi:hypothetical protein